MGPLPLTDYRRILGAIRDAYRADGVWWDARATEREAEHTVLRKRRGWPSPWPWLPTHWSRQTHAQFPNLAFRTPVREFLKVARFAVLAGMDAETRAGLCELVIKHLAAMCAAEWTSLQPGAHAATYSETESDLDE